MGGHIDPRIQLEAVAKTLREGRPSPSISVRTFLEWFWFQRRTYGNVQYIRYLLNHVGLRTSPDFEATWLDGLIKFSLADADSTPASPGSGGTTESESGDNLESAAQSDSAQGIAGDKLAGPTSPDAPPIGPETLGIEETPEDGAPDDSSGPVIGETALIPTNEGAPEETGGQTSDPSHRISKLAAANHPPDSVAPDSPLVEAITIMLTNDYSQVPVMPNERDVKGVVTWHSIGSRQALGIGATSVREVTDRASEISHDASIFEAIPKVVESGYVLVRGPDNRVMGIVTSSDLNFQFQQLAEPFLILSEIENRIRDLISARFDKSELASVRDPDDVERDIDSVEDLTFGEYIRLLEEPGRWATARLRVDRRIFIKALDNVRQIRNDVMHFDPDPLPDEDLQSLRDFARFLQRLKTMGVT